MNGYMRVEDVQKKIKQKVDSLLALPEELRVMNEPWEQILTAASASLKSAYDKMDAWMANTSFDTLKNDPDQRIKYFTQQRISLDTVTNELNGALHAADSLLMKNK